LQHNCLAMENACNIVNVVGTMYTVADNSPCKLYTCRTFTYNFASTLKCEMSLSVKGQDRYRCKLAASYRH